MTTISIPGKITAIEIDEGEVDFAIITPTPDYQYEQPQTSPAVPKPLTIIYPSGKRYTIVLPQYLDPVSNIGAFQLDSSFQIGDIVELYIVSNSGSLYDENGHFVGPSNANLGNGVRLRKIATGSTFPTWGHI